MSGSQAVKVFVLVVAFLAMISVCWFADYTFYPSVQREAALDQFDAKKADSAFVVMRATQSSKNVVKSMPVVVTFVLGIALFWKEVKRGVLYLFQKPSCR